VTGTFPKVVWAIIAADRFTPLARRAMQRQIKAPKIKIPESGAYSESALFPGLSISLVSMRN
jgi:hypothetical protein